MTKQAISIKNILTATLTLALLVLVSCGGDNQTDATNPNLNAQLLNLDQQNESVYPDSYRPGLGFGDLFQYVMQLAAEAGTDTSIYENRLAITMQVLGTDDFLLACDTVKNAEIHLRRIQHPIENLDDPTAFDTTTRVLTLTEADCQFDSSMHFVKYANFQSESIAPLWVYLIEKHTHKVYAYGSTQIMTSTTLGTTDGNIHSGPTGNVTIGQ